MSKQEVLYETDQYFTYKGKKLHIRFIDEYFDLVPRPINEEKALLKEDIHQNGLSESIKINVEGIVLDGHTRIEICEELGWKRLDEKPIKANYDIKIFDTKEEERDYVIKTNLMRRQLNAFQKVRLVSKLYKENPHTQREQTRYYILLELKKYGKPMKVNAIAEKIGQHRANALKVLKGLKEDYCVRCEEEEISTGTKKSFLFSILPKGEETLYKGMPNKITLKTLGRSIGVQRDYVSRAIFLLNHAPPHMLAKLEHGQIGIMSAFVEITKEDRAKRVTSYSYLRGTTKVICPHCEQISMKKEWKIYDGKD